MHHSAESLNEAAAKGVVIDQLNSKTLAAAFYRFRDRGEYVSGQTELILCVKDSDYESFIEEDSISQWIEFTRKKQLHLLGLDGIIQGITIFTDAFLPKHQKILKQNILFKLPDLC